MSSTTSKIVIAVLLSSLIICVDCKANDTTTFSVRIEGGEEVRQSVYYENSTHQDNIAGINDGLSAKFVKDCPRRGSRMRHSCGMVTKKKMGEEYFCTSLARNVTIENDLLDSTTFKCKCSLNATDNDAMVESFKCRMFKFIIDQRPLNILEQR